MIQFRTQVLVSIAVAGFAANSQAQLSGVIANTSFQITNGSLPFGAAVYQNGVIGASTYTTVTTGDFTVLQPFPTNATSWREMSTGFDTFHVGPVPVEISNVRLSANYKLVNSGGETSGFGTVTTQLGYGLSIRQRVGAVFNNFNDPFVTNDIGARAPLVGNGFIIDSFTMNSTHAPFVLTPGLFYYFQMEAFVTSVGNSGYIGPQIGTTMEFGGPLSAGTFAGFTSAFDYRTVPTPGASSLLALGGLMAARRR